MKVLQVLEEKIAALAEIIQELKRGNAKLAEENAQLLIRVDSLKGSVLEDSKRKEETVLAVDDLIKSIDCLVTENQQ